LPIANASEAMLRLLADENLNAHIVRGLRRRLAGLDLVTVQSLGMVGADVRRCLPMPGVIEVVGGASLGTALRGLGQSPEVVGRCLLMSIGV
jgi:hypothetical protein